MKKIAVFLFALLFLFPWKVHAADQWAKAEPAGTRNASDIDYYIGINNEALDRLDTNFRNGTMVIYASAATLTVLPGEIAILNAAGTVVRWRKNTSNTTVAWTDIDTGPEAVSTQYYVYVLADADATTFTVKISTSSSAPTGATYYRKIGYFYNNSSGDIESVGNVPGGNVVNAIWNHYATQRSTTSTTFVDISNTTIYFISTGRPIEIIFWGAFKTSGNLAGGVQIYLDSQLTGSVSGGLIDAGAASYNGQDLPTYYVANVAAGAHTIKAQYRVSSGTLYAERTTILAREL